MTLNLLYLQIYIAGGVNNNTWGKSVLEYQIGAYSQNIADSGSAAMFAAQASGLTGLRTLEVDDNAICVSAGSHKFYSGGNATERLTITSTGEIKQYGFTGTSDTAADDLVLGNTTDGVNRGITIWSHSSQNGTLVFADNDSNFRGAVQYIHNGDRMRFLTAGDSILEIKEKNLPHTLINQKLLRSIA